MSTNTLLKVWNSNNIRFNKETRFVCLTDMAKASNKLLNDWCRLKGSKSYLETLSRATGIPVGTLLHVENGVTTWGHPKVALRFAQWCSDEFAVQVDFWVDELLTTGKVEIASTVKTSAVLNSVELIHLIGAAIDTSYLGLNLKPELLAGLKLNAIEQFAPEVAPYLAESRQLLINNTAQEHQLLTATEIGNRLGISAQAVNKKLIELGYQTKNDNKRSKKDCSYLPIGQGYEFSDLTLATGAGKDNTTYQQLRWYDSILSQL